MKTQLIILEQGNILVSDEEIKEGDTYVVPHNIEGEILSSRLKISIAHKNFMLNYYVKEIKNWYKKLIASDNTEHCLPNIDYSALSNEDCKKIGYVDIEKLIYGCFGEKEWKSLHKNAKLSLIETFKMRNLNDKKFSLEDMKSVSYACFSLYRNNEFSDDELEMEFERIFNNNIKSLQPKVFNVEVEMKNDEFIINKIL